MPITEKYPRLIEKLHAGWLKYLRQKLSTKSLDADSFLAYCNAGGTTTLERACDAAEKLNQEYDMTIEIANDGLWLGYIFSQYGIPTKAVKMARKGKGATWKPLEELPDLGGKRVLLLDNDVVTGRTLIRACREIQQFKPAYIDSLLMMSVTPIRIRNFKRYWTTEEDGCLMLESEFPNIVGVRATEAGMHVYVRPNEIPEEEIARMRAETLSRGMDKYPCCRLHTCLNDELVWIQCSTNLPEEVRKLMTLSEDFSHSPDAILRLEKRLL